MTGGLSSWPQFTYTSIAQQRLAKLVLEVLDHIEFSLQLGNLSEAAFDLSDEGILRSSRRDIEDGVVQVIARKARNCSRLVQEG